MVFTISTYVGFVFFAAGSLWNADIVSKIKKVKEQCKKMREQRARKNASGAGMSPEGTSDDLEKSLLPVAAEEARPKTSEGGEENCAT